MTALRAPIVVDNASGSDSAASGVGPASAITGTNAAHTGGSSTNVITLTNTPNLAAVQAGDLLFLNTSSGRKFSVIQSADNGADTVTVDDNFNIGAGSPVSYAIGGKRLTLDNADTRLIFSQDWKAGWSMELIHTGAVYTISGTALTLFRPSDAATFRVFGSGGRPIIRQSSNVPCFEFSDNVNIYYLELENLHLQNNSGTKTICYGVRKQAGASGGLVCRDVIFGDATNQLSSCVVWEGSSTAFGAMAFFDCQFKNAVDFGIYSSSQQGLQSVIGCEIHNNGSRGIYLFGGQFPTILNTIIDNNGSDGIWFDGQGGGPTGHVIGCTFHDNAGNGILCSSDFWRGRFCNNLFTDNGAYGINMGTQQAPHDIFYDYNAYRGNTSGARNNLTAGANDVTLSADPYVNAGSRDFTLNNTAGGGLAAKAVGFPPAFQSGLANYLDLGAVQRQEPISAPAAKTILIGTGVSHV